jgi:hypothetical protein
MISELNGLIQHMHYVDFDSKNKQTIIRFAIYVVLGLIAIAVSYLVILGARGYDVDPATRKVVRNGLILTWSQPESVDVYVNGNLEDNTPARFPLPVGQYDMKMSKLGYRDWTKTVNLRASEVIKLNYPRLFPNEITAKPVTSLSEVSGWLQSGDQETIAVHVKPGSRDIILYSVKDIEAQPKLMTIPRQFLTEVAGSTGIINLHQWSADSDYLMVEHINGDLTEYIRINVIDNEFVNINKTMTLELTNLQFDRSENNKMYGLTNNQLRRIDIGDKVASAALVAQVVDYRVASDGRVLAIQKRDKLSSLLMIDRDDNISTVLSAPTTATAQLELGNYDDEDYAVVALSPSETKLVWLDEKENRNSDMIATIPGKNVQVYPVSFTGRFAVVSSGDVVTVHDFEKLRVFEFEFDGMTPESLSWFDDGHLITTTRNGAIDVIEFDGKNKTNIGKGKNFKVYTDKDFNNFYSLGAGQNSKIDLNVSNLLPQ